MKPSSDPRDCFLRARKASERLNMPHVWLRTSRERRQREIPYYLIGRQIRFRLSDLLEWQRAHGYLVIPEAQR
jgi:hypothetical protein